MPPNGAGPATAVVPARAPVRSSPAHVTPVRTHPRGRGHGSQTGTFARRTTSARTSTLGWTTGCWGRTVPCRLQDQTLDHSPGGWTAPAQRGHEGSPFMAGHGPPPRAVPSTQAAYAAA